MHWDDYQKHLASSDILYGMTGIARFLGVSRSTLYRMLSDDVNLPIVRLDYHRTFASKQMLSNYIRIASATNRTD